MAVQSAALFLVAHEMVAQAEDPEERAYWLGTRDAFEAIFLACQEAGQCDTVADPVFEAHIVLAGLQEHLRDQLVDQCRSIMRYKRDRTGL